MKNNKKDKVKKPVDHFIKYSTLAIEMGAIIGVMTFAGVQLDQYFETDPLFTVILSLAGTFGAIFRIIKQLIKS